MIDTMPNRRRLVGVWIVSFFSFVAAGCSGIDEANGSRSISQNAANTPPTVPQWYDANRVQAHTRLPFRRHPTDAEFFTQTSERVRALGAHVLVRHIKSVGETPVWLDESDVEETEIGRADEKSALSRLFDSASRAGLHTIAYYWHITNDRLAEKHPEWVCRDAKGRPQTHQRGTYLDITGPYKLEVSQALLQAAAAGADGFYFDHRHLPAGPCLGTRLESAYEDQYGEPPPKKKRDDSDDYLRWRQFRASEMAATFRFWMQAVHEQFPETVFIISATTLPALTSPDMTTELISHSPAKTEFRNALRSKFTERVFEKNFIGLAVPDRDIRIAAGWAVMRDASGGLPPHVWAPSFPNEAHALGFAASVVTHGGIANMSVADELLLGEPIPTTKTPAPALRSAFDLGNRVSPYLRGTRPVRWAAVHFSERARDERWPDNRNAWSEVLWPFIGAYGALLRSGVPVGVVNDQQLASDQLDEYEVLVLTNPEDLDEAQQTAVKAFRDRGGLIVENKREWEWHKRSTSKKASTAFMKHIQPHLIRAPVQITANQQEIHGIAYEKLTEDGRQLVVALTPNFSWVQDVIPKQSVVKTKINPTPPPVPAGVTIKVRDSSLVDLSAGEIRVVEAMTGETLQTRRTDKDLQFEMPAFERFSLAVITAAEDKANP